MMGFASWQIHRTESFLAMLRIQDDLKDGQCDIHLDGWASFFPGK
jgi:hypothetical protein